MLKATCFASAVNLRATGSSWPKVVRVLRACSGMSSAAARAPGLVSLSETSSQKKRSAFRGSSIRALAAPSSP